MPQHASNNPYIHIQYVLCFLWLIMTQLVISSWCQNLDQTSVTDLSKCNMAHLALCSRGSVFLQSGFWEGTDPKTDSTARFSPWFQLRNWNYMQESQESCKVTLPVHPGFFCHLPIGWKQLGEKDDWRGFWMQITLIVHEHDGFELEGYINTDGKKKMFCLF